MHLDVNEFPRKMVLGSLEDSIRVTSVSSASEVEEKQNLFWSAHPQRQAHARPGSLLSGVLGARAQTGRVTAEVLAVLPV